MDYVSFISNEGIIVNICEKYIHFSNFLEMLVHHAVKGEMIKTGVSSYDLSIANAMMTVGFSPCPYQTLIQPQEFVSFQTLCDYFGIDFDVDYENIYIKEFSSLMGLKEEENNDEIDRYEGWTSEMIYEQELEDRLAEEKMSRIMIQKAVEDEWVDFFN